MAKTIKEEKVELTIPRSDVNVSINTEVCFVNGKRYELKVGETMLVPRVVKDILTESSKTYIKSQKNENNGTMLSTY